MPAFGGQNYKNLDIIKNEAVATFAAQNRAVTKEDYILRVYSMPSKYGSIAKTFIENDFVNSNTLNLYIISKDDNGTFQLANPALKNNIVKYLSNYRILTDAIELLDPYIVNIGINFEIIARPSYNSNEVILTCINKLKELLHQDKMEINSPIVLSKIYTELDKL